MSETERTPIFDKNGKPTHVHKKVVPAGSTERVPVVAPTPAVVEDAKRLFPNATEIHPYQHDCESCKAGTSIRVEDWDKAKPYDVVELLKYNEFYPEEGGIENKTGDSLFNLVMMTAFDEYQTQDFQTAMREEYLDLLKDSEAVNNYSGKGPYYDEILAVDPVGCGCTECSIGEYVPEQVWRENATGGDILNLISGQVSNHTYNTDFGAIFYSYLRDSDARQLESDIIEEFGSIVGSINSEYLAERYS